MSSKMHRVIELKWDGTAGKQHIYSIFLSVSSVALLEGRCPVTSPTQLAAGIKYRSCPSSAAAVWLLAHTHSRKTSQKKRLLLYTCITSHFLMKENKMLSRTWLLPRSAFTIQLPGWRSHTHTYSHTLWAKHPGRFLGQQDVQKLSDWLLMPLVSEWEFAPRCCMFLCCYCRHVFHSADWQPSTSAL